MLGTVQLRNGNFAQTEPSNTWAPTAINNRADRSLIWQSDAGRWQQVTITAWRWLCCKLHVPEPMWNVQYLAPFHPFNSKRDWILRQRWRHHQVQRPTIPPKENTANLKTAFLKQIGADHHSMHRHLPAEVTYHANKSTLVRDRLEPRFSGVKLIDRSIQRYTWNTPCPWSSGCVVCRKHQLGCGDKDGKNGLLNLTVTRRIIIGVKWKLD